MFKQLVDVWLGEKWGSSYSAAHQPFAAGFGAARAGPVGVGPQLEPHRRVCEPIGVRKIADADEA